MTELRLHINAGNLWNLPDFSAIPRDGDEIDYVRVQAAGFCGLQHYFPEPAAFQAGMDMSGMGRILRPSEAMAVAKQHKSWGFVASTWHVGDGF